LKERVPYVTLDTWVPELAAAATDQGGGADLWLAGKDEETATPAIFTTAMRYLPPGLDAWRKKKSPSEILIALCAPDAADRAGIDLLLGTEEIAKMISLADFRPDQEGGDESGLFTDLKKRDMPRIIVSIGRSNRAAEVARCVAAYWGIEHVRVAAGEFPYMLGGEISPLMCSSFTDIASYLCTQANFETKFATHSGDVGWSTYWRLLTKRKTADYARDHPIASLAGELPAHA